jgi:ABC-type multidrug transport system fused ATPase/permease subunit
MKDMTTLIITNRVPTIELCDEVIFIENGKVKAQGKHEDMIKNDEAYMNLFLEEERLKSTK